MRGPCGRPPGRISRRRDERGSATVFVLGFAIMLLVCAGLVIDGGGAINARMKLADDAEQAARAGANAIDIDLLRSTGVVALDPGQAQAEAGGFLSSLGYGNYSVNADGTDVTVTVHDTVPTDMLSFVGINQYDISATVTASAETG